MAAVVLLVAIACRPRAALPQRGRADRGRGPGPPGGAHDDGRGVPRRLGALGRAPADRAALRRGPDRQRGAAAWRPAWSPSGRVGPLGAVLARPSRRSSSPCRGWSRCRWCRRSPCGSPCSRTGARSTRSRKARLFLHGRLLHGLKLMVATFIGTLAIMVAQHRGRSRPVVLLLVALATVLPVWPLIVVGRSGGAAAGLRAHRDAGHVPLVGLDDRLRDTGGIVIAAAMPARRRPAPLAALFAVLSPRLGGEAERGRSPRTRSRASSNRRGPATPARAGRCTCSTSIASSARSAACCAPTPTPRT